MKTKRRNKTKPDFSKPQYEALMNVIDLNRAEIGKYCDVSTHAVSWWKSQRSIPRRHLKVLLSLLIEKMRGGELGPLENGIMKVFITKGLMTEEHLQQMRDGVKPDFMSSSPKLASFNIREVVLEKNAASAEAECAQEHAPIPKSLDEYKIDDLVDAIQKQGWIVNLSRNNSK